jgi:ribosomal protein S3
MLKIRVKSKVIRRVMYHYFMYKNWNYVDTITQVKVYLTLRGHYLVKVTSHKPGVFIGKAGIFINGLEEHLTKELKRKTKIYIYECKLWHKLYK